MPRARLPVSVKRALESTEKDFLAQVLETARLGHWVTYHTFDSRRSQEGFPDIVALHPERRLLLFAELKRSKRATVSPAQIAWLAALRMATEGIADRVLGRLWTPEDWEAIKALLLEGRVLLKTGSCPKSEAVASKGGGE